MKHPRLIKADCVRLAFQAYAMDGGKIVSVIRPIVSNKIRAKKSNSVLAITEISDTSAPVCGGKKVMLFCEKVNKNEIGLRFYEQSASGDIVWQVDVTDKYVHRQVGISFRTPAYIDQDIDEPVKVYFEMFADSEDGVSVSKPIEFEMLPIDCNLQMKRKRKRVQEQDFCE